MLTFKMIMMFLCTLILVLLTSFMIACIFAGAIFKGIEHSNENAIGIAWTITSILLSITCVMLAYS